VKVRPIQTIWEYFQPNKMARAFEKGCIVAKKGAKGSILREICPLRKITPKYNAASGIIAGELLRLLRYDRLYLGIKLMSKVIMSYLFNCLLNWCYSITLVIHWGMRCYAPSE
jgi:hypothetical protein